MHFLHILILSISVDIDWEIHLNLNCLTKETTKLIYIKLYDFCWNFTIWQVLLAIRFLTIFANIIFICVLEAKNCAKSSMFNSNDALVILKLFHSSLHRVMITRTIRGIFHCTKKWSFPLRISLVNVFKSTVCCGFGHIYWRNP